MNPFLHDVVAEAVRRQPWYQRNANTIVAGLVMVSAILSFIATLELHLPASVAAGIPVAVTAIGTLVTKLTKNGVQPSTLAKLDATEAARRPDGSVLMSAELARTRAQIESGYIGKHRLDP